jgi:hypothetical protein
MSKSPVPHTRFELAVHEGYQFTERGHTRIKLLFSIADASHQWVGWYTFLEGQLPIAGKAYDNILMSNRTRAEETIQFGNGVIDRVPIQVRQPRTADGFINRGLKEQRISRIHDARFTDRNKDGGDPSSVSRLDMLFSFDLITGTARETIRANVSMLSLERPHGNVHPALGYFSFLRRERYGQAQFPSHEIDQIMLQPVS